MALIRCSTCRTSFYDTWSSCPKCGWEGFRSNSRVEASARPERTPPREEATGPGHAPDTPPPAQGFLDESWRALASLVVSLCAILRWFLSVGGYVDWRHACAEMLPFIAAGIASPQFIAALRARNSTQGVAAVLALVMSVLAFILPYTKV